MATVYAVASAKGGVGKTTTAAAVATVLAGSGADVVAVDADVGMANLAGSLGIEVGDTTIHDVLAGHADPADAVHDGPNGLRVVPGTTDLDAYAAADPAVLRQVIDAFASAEFVILDVGAGLSHESTLPLGLADETLLVSTPERDALGDTEKTRQLTERLGGTVAGAAITRADPDAPESEDALVSELLGTEVLCWVPEDPAVIGASTAGEPLLTFAPTAPVSHAYRELTRTLTGVAIEEPTGDAVAHDGEDAGDDTDDKDTGDDTDDKDTGDDTDDKDTGDDTADEDGTIIVADDGPAGLEPAGDADEIIVAEETGGDQPSEPAAPVEGAESETADASDAATGSESADEMDPESAITDPEPAGEMAPTAESESAETNSPDSDSPESAGTPRMERDDDAPIEDGEDESVTDEQVTDEPVTDEDDGEESIDDASAPAQPEDGDEVDDELAGSVPFRDDDTGMETVLSRERDEDEEEDEKSGGFFSRLFGR